MDIEKVEFEQGVPITVKVQKISRAPIHYHENITEILLPLKGDIKVTTNFECNTVNSGDFFFVNNLSIHSIESLDKSLVAIFYIDLNYFEPLYKYIKYMFFRTSKYDDVNLKDNSKNNRYEYIRCQHKKKFRHLLINMLNEFAGNKTCPQESFKEFGNIIVGYMIYEFNWLQFVQKNNKFISLQQLDRYHRIVKYIQEHYKDKISLDDIINREFITKNYLSHFWKDLSSYSLKERISYERVLKSEFLLLNSDMTVSEISYHCGFSDVKYYYQSFKRWYKCLPLQHKEKCNTYKEQGCCYEDLNMDEIREVLKKYTGTSPVIENNSLQELDNISYIEDYLKIKHMSFLEESSEVKTSKQIVIDIFKHKNVCEKDEASFFDWTSLDLWVNLAMSSGFNLNIKLKYNHDTRELFYEGIDKFLADSINRYDLKILLKWKFIINLGTLSLCNTIAEVDEIFHRHLKKVKATYSFDV